MVLMRMRPFCALGAFSALTLPPKMVAPPLPDRIASLVHAQFHALPRSSKPRILEDGAREWTPLAGVVLGLDRNEGMLDMRRHRTEADLGVNYLRKEGGELKCVALGTGTKCLPHRQLSTARGLLLHDSHAEILAIRAFNRFLLEECRALLLTRRRVRAEVQHGQTRSSRETFDGSPILQRTRTIDEQDISQPFSIRDNISIYLYCSKAPCGDASMDLLTESSDDPTPWETLARADDMPHPESVPLDGSSPVTPPLEGRGYFGTLGIVRRKPARRDAPLTLCKSCTDKLSLAQCASLLRTPASLLVRPSNAYITALVVPKSEFHETGFKRAFSDEGRMRELKDRTWDGGYAFSAFDVLTTNILFEFAEGAKPGNVGAVWCADGEIGIEEGARGLNESIIGAVKQGAAVQKVVDPENREPRKGASGVCRRRLWKLGREVVDLLGDDDGGGDGAEGLRETFGVETYEALKGIKAAEGRRRVKRDVEGVLAPKGWVRNCGDERWGLGSALS